MDEAKMREILAEEWMRAAPGVDEEGTEDWRAGLAAMRRIRDAAYEEAAKVADEFERPGPRSPADLGPLGNGIWSNCSTRIAVCIRSLSKPLEKGA